MRWLLPRRSDGAEGGRLTTSVEGGFHHVSQDSPEATMFQRLENQDLDWNPDHYQLDLPRASGVVQKTSRM